MRTAAIFLFRPGPRSLVTSQTADEKSEFSLVNIGPRLAEVSQRKYKASHWLKLTSASADRPAPYTVIYRTFWNYNSNAVLWVRA